MRFWKLFKPKSCIVKLKAADKDEALREIVTQLVKGGSLDAEFEDKAIEALRERERLASTGVGMSVAIPHVKITGLERAACSLAIHPGGLEWAAVDGNSVSIFFTVLRPARPGEQHDPQAHLEMMSWIARLGRDADFRRFAEGARTKTELVDLLKEMSAV
ncbi:MAG: PTS sugar transporter subunit IIA [Planctomycetota bacterium]|jgi:mannitol/fructose-specific phosphotransferase system IIA component (Ntr-type)|nr:PTS sugar transporter subunit IIA [Planctomycetota bacterium]MDP6988270.1 PTS sugar transporter subunit IIA [Planctomycetota bacterium]